MKFCKDCGCCRPDQSRCNKGFFQGQIDCPEFEEKDKWLETCEDCVYFDVYNHKMFCKYIGASMASDNRSGCIRFKNKKQAVTTRNPYLFHGYVTDANENAKLANEWVKTNPRKEYNKMFKMNKVKKVIFNPPATIVYWFDGTKTIVKVQDGEVFDKEKGFAMACAKKFFGNKGNYYNEFRKHGADNHCYSVHIDLAHSGEVVKSSIGDGISYDGAGSVSMSPNKIREMVGFPPIDNADCKVEFESCHLQEPVKREKEESKKERIQKKKEYIDDIALKAAVDCNLYVEVVESNDGDVEYAFSFMHDDNKYKRKHCIGYDEFDVYSQEYLGNRLECRIGVWLGELAKAGVEPEKKESE